MIDSGILTGANAGELAELKEITNPADLTRGIAKIQTQLISLAPAKTRAKHFREHLDMGRFVGA